MASEHLLCQAVLLDPHGPVSCSLAIAHVELPSRPCFTDEGAEGQRFNNLLEMKQLVHCKAEELSLLWPDAEARCLSSATSQGLVFLSPFLRFK